jgi:hypothetical protein
MQMNSYPQELSTGVQSLWTTRRAHAGIIHILISNLTLAVRWFRLKRAVVRCSSQGRNRLMGKVYAITALLSITTTMEATAANYSTDHLKLYAHSRLISYDQFQCFNKIITKESRWSYTARNNSHYGLGQMRSTWYRDLDPYRQIDASLRYITKRYKTPCKAWVFHQERNYY